MNTILSWTLPWSRILRPHQTPYRWVKNLLLMLLLVLPFLAMAQSSSQNGTQNNDVLNSTQSDAFQTQVVPRGFIPVNKQWCAFLPELPLCTTPVTGPVSLTGTGLIPAFWCSFFPNLPACDGGRPDTGGLLKPLTGFGSNPGNLDAFTYVPADSGASPRALVVALHGCTQKASNYDDETGWVQLADKFHFAMLFPQQKTANNPSNCFNWFDPIDNQRNRGEALSIKQMIDTMLADTSLNLDKKQVYVTGLSGGGAMTAVMMATYPEVFAGAAPIAGLPYGCAHDLLSAFTCMGKIGNVPDLSPAEWGNRVTTASPSSTFPRVSIWHGTRDGTVKPENAREMIEQWTNVLGLSQTPQVDATFKTTRHQVFEDSTGRPMVEAYFVNNMAHGTPIDPGSGNDQCGKSPHDIYTIEAGICSSFFISKFWGLTPIIAEPPASPASGSVMMSPFAPVPTSPGSGN